MIARILAPFGEAPINRVMNRCAPMGDGDELGLILRGADWVVVACTGLVST